MRQQKGLFQQELYDKIWKTKGSRFNAYERLKRRQKLSNYATGLLSAYLIIVNLLSPFGLISLSQDSNVISFISVALSIILLVFVTIENAAEYSLKGNHFHNCAKELSRIFNELHILIQDEKSTSDDFRRVADEYMEIVERYDNHSPIDYEVHKTKHQDDFDIPWLEKQWILFKSKVLVDIQYYVFMIIPPITGLWYFWNYNVS